MINHIELAKECGAHMAVDHEGNLVPIFYNNSLTAFANAIIEECAKVVDDNDEAVEVRGGKRHLIPRAEHNLNGLGYSEGIRALKVI